MAADISGAGEFGAHFLPLTPALILSSIAYISYCDGNGIIHVSSIRCVASQLNQSAKDVFIMMFAAIFLVVILAMINVPLAKCAHSGPCCTYVNCLQLRQSDRSCDLLGLCYPCSSYDAKCLLRKNRWLEGKGRRSPVSLLQQTSFASRKSLLVQFDTLKGIVMNSNSNVEI